MKFVPELPVATTEAGSLGGYRPEYKDFAEELKQHPWMWAEFPREFKNKNQCANVVKGIKSGDYTAFRPPLEWEATQRMGKVYVRYTGPKPLNENWKGKPPSEG